MQIRVAFFKFLKNPVIFFFKCEKQQCNVAAVTKNIDQINKTITHVPKNLVYLPCTKFVDTKVKTIKITP